MTADNGIGLQSWKSSASPDGSGNVWIRIAFGQSRTFTRIKLYNLAADPLTSYVLQYWTGSAWVTFAGTPDKYTNPAGAGGYGQGGYGSGPYGGVSNGGWPGLGYTGGLDAYDFAPITSTQIQLIVYATHSGGPAQVVEIEAYRLIDITSRCRDLPLPDRAKDFKLQQPIACQVVGTLDNTDQFFSISYTPTAAQIAAGYVNSELKQFGMGLEVNEGFYTTNGIELIRTFTGSVDSITPTAGTAQMEIEARDGIKFLMNNDTCRLRLDNPTSSIPGEASGSRFYIETAIQYILNRYGVSNYEMNLASSLIALPVFFYYETAGLTNIQTLLQAAGDAMFFFDENGSATFQFYLTATPQGNVYTAEAEWEAGTLTNIDSTGMSGQIARAWWLFDNFSEGKCL